MISVKPQECQKRPYAIVDLRSLASHLFFNNSWYSKYITTIVLYIVSIYYFIIHTKTYLNLAICGLLIYLKHIYYCSRSAFLSLKQYSSGLGEYTIFTNVGSCARELVKRGIRNKYISFLCIYHYSKPFFSNFHCVSACKYYIRAL